MNVKNLYINSLNNLNFFYKYSIYFFNFLVIVCGIFVFCRTITNINVNNLNTVITNCNNIYLYDFLALINSFTILLTISGIFELTILGFLSNVIISVLNYKNILNMDKDCINYYKNYNNNVLFYYGFNVIIQTLNNLFFILILSLIIRYICILRNTKYTILEEGNNNNLLDDNINHNNNRKLYEDIIDTEELS